MLTSPYIQLEVQWLWGITVLKSLQFLKWCTHPFIDPVVSSSTTPNLTLISISCHPWRAGNWKFDQNLKSTGSHSHTLQVVGKNDVLFHAKFHAQCTMLPIWGKTPNFSAFAILKFKILWWHYLVVGTSWSAHTTMNLPLTTTTTPQPFYGPFSGTTRVNRCQKRTSGLYGTRGDLQRQTHSPSGWAPLHLDQAVPTSTIPQFFYGLDALPAAQRTVSKHWRQLRNLPLTNVIKTFKNIVGDIAQNCDRHANTRTKNIKPFHPDSVRSSSSP